MNGKLRALIVAVAALSLAGGGMTYALWQDKDYLNTDPLVAGNLDVAMIDGWNWVDHAGRNLGPNPAASFRAAPGDVLTATRPVSLGLEGDNLIAQVSVSRGGVDAGHGQVGGTLPAGWRKEGALEAAGAAIPGVLLTVDLLDADGNPLIAPTDAAGSYFQASSIDQSGGVDEDPRIPIIFGVEATAADDEPDLFVKVTATFDPATVNTDRTSQTLALSDLVLVVRQVPSDFVLP